MKKILMFSGLMLVVLLASCTKAEQEQVTAVITENASQTQEVAMEEKTSETMELAPGFSEYQENLIGDRSDTVLFFHQESCGTCKTTEKDLIENGVPENLQVLKIDIDADSSVELKKKYGVTMKHTFVQVDVDGNLIKKWNGSMSADDIIEQLDHSDTMMKDDDSMIEGDHEGEWTEEEMKKMEMMEGEHTNDSMEKMEKEDAMMKDDESQAAVVVEAPVALAGTYGDYDSTLVGQTQDTVLFFHANWCPSCRAADTGISEGTVPDGLTILKADFDNNTDLKKKYGVVSQHTFVQVDANGEMIKKWLGGNNVDDVVKQLK